MLQPCNDNESVTHTPSIPRFLKGGLDQTRIENPYYKHSTSVERTSPIAIPIATWNVFLNALEDAMEIATRNVPKIDGKVYVFPDVSGSMQSPVTGCRDGATSQVSCVDVAALVAASILRVNPDAEVIPFECDVVPISLNPRDSIMTNAQKLGTIGGGGTNCSAPLAYLNSQQKKGDLVIYISDNESWIDSSRLCTSSNTIYVLEVDAEAGFVEVEVDTTTLSSRFKCLSHNELTAYTEDFSDDEMWNTVKNTEKKLERVYRLSPMVSRETVNRETETMKQWNIFKERSPQAKMVCIDIQPNRSTQASEREDIINVGGFSDQVFSVIADVAAGVEKNHWVRTIEGIIV